MPSAKIHHLFIGQSDTFTQLPVERPGHRWRPSGVESGIRLQASEKEEGLFTVAERADKSYRELNSHGMLVGFARGGGQGAVLPCGCNWLNWVSFSGAVYHIPFKHGDASNISDWAIRAIKSHYLRLLLAERPVAETSSQLPPHLERVLSDISKSSRKFPALYKKFTELNELVLVYSMGKNTTTAHVDTIFSTIESFRAKSDVLGRDAKDNKVYFEGIKKGLGALQEYLASSNLKLREWENAKAKIEAISAKELFWYALGHLWVVNPVGANKLHDVLLPLGANFWATMERGKKLEETLISKPQEKSPLPFEVFEEPNSEILPDGTLAEPHQVLKIHENTFRIQLDTHTSLVNFPISVFNIKILGKSMMEWRIKHEKSSMPQTTWKKDFIDDAIDICVKTGTLVNMLQTY